MDNYFDKYYSITNKFDNRGYHIIYIIKTIQQN